ECLRSIRPALTPSLKCSCVLHLSLLVEVVGVKDEGLPFRVEHAAIRLLSFTGTGYIVDFRYVEIAGSHEFANVAVLCQQLILLIQCGIAIMESLSQLLNFGRQLSYPR